VASTSTRPAAPATSASTASAATTRPTPGRTPLVSGPESVARQRVAMARLRSGSAPP
jgi:hypothetical protein